MHSAHGSLSLRQYGDSPGSHAHAHFQILLGVDGALEIEVQGKGRRIAAGEGCVIAPWERHDFEAPHKARCLVLDTADSEWAACAGNPARPDAALALANYLAVALEHSRSLAWHHGPALLLDCWRTPMATGTRSRRSIDWAALAQWCQGRMHEPLTVSDLAQQVCLSPTQFAARCRQETGLSAMHWLRDLRLTRAHALRAQGLSLAVVATRCGYQSASALATALRMRHSH
jgi:transcriptional regulator GlxA family with amidase domain